MAVDVSGNDSYLLVDDDFHSSIDNYTYEESNDETESFSEVNYPESHDYSSDFQNVFTLLSLMIGVTIGGLCFLVFMKGFK